jgi:hypothetical protein
MNTYFPLESLDDPILTQIIMITFQYVRWDVGIKHIISYQDYLNWYNGKSNTADHFNIIYDVGWTATILLVNKKINMIMQKLLPLIFNRDIFVKNVSYPPISHYYNNIHITFNRDVKYIILWELFTRLKGVNGVSSDQISITQLEKFSPKMRVLRIHIEEDEYLNMNSWRELIKKFSQLTTLEVNMLIFDLPNTLKCLILRGNRNILPSPKQIVPNWQHITTLMMDYINHRVMKNLNLSNCINLQRIRLKGIGVSGLSLLDKLTYCMLCNCTIDGLPSNLEELNVIKVRGLHSQLSKLFKLKKLSAYKINETIQLSDIKDLKDLSLINYFDSDISISNEVKALSIAVLSQIGDV